MRVVAALSGGVDSAVAAARAIDAGHDVVGVHLALAPAPAAQRNGSRGCCTLEDARDARRVADLLGIPFFLWDMAEPFKREVVDDFVAEYAAGRTPNPCIRCNERIKFAAVLDRAVALGFDAVCTGHYARVVDGAHGVELHRGADPAKDQSYVLGVIGAEALSRALFPLGVSTKPEVRAEAAERGLLVADKKDSHDVCFVADGDTAGFLARRLGARPGPVVDDDGVVVGAHEGAYAFTVGQRRGLGLADASPDGRPRYVLGIDVVSNTVRVGPHDQLAVGVVETSAPRWCGSRPDGAFTCTVQWRAHGEAVAATVVHAGDTLRIDLSVPVRGVAAGQEAVLYDGTRIVGSARIARAMAPSCDGVTG